MDVESFQFGVLKCRQFGDGVDMMSRPVIAVSMVAKWTIIAALLCSCQPGERSSSPRGPKGKMGQRPAKNVAQAGDTKRTPAPLPPSLEALFALPRSFTNVGRDAGPARPQRFRVETGPRLPLDPSAPMLEWKLGQEPKRWRIVGKGAYRLTAVELMGPDGLPWPVESTLERDEKMTLAEIQTSTPLLTGRLYHLAITTSNKRWRVPVRVAAGVDTTLPW